MLASIAGNSNGVKQLEDGLPCGPERAYDFVIDELLQEAASMD